MTRSLSSKWLASYSVVRRHCLHHIHIIIHIVQTSFEPLSKRRRRRRRRCFFSSLSFHHRLANHFLHVLVSLVVHVLHHVHNARRGILLGRRGCLLALLTRESGPLEKEERRKDKNESTQEIKRTEK